jgi:hypothetical protein
MPITAVFELPDDVNRMACGSALELDVAIDADSLNWRVRGEFAHDCLC